MGFPLVSAACLQCLLLLFKAPSLSFPTTTTYPGRSGNRDISFSKEAMRKLVYEEELFRPSFADVEDEDFEDWFDKTFNPPKWPERITRNYIYTEGTEEGHELVGMDFEMVLGRSGGAEQHHVRALKDPWEHFYTRFRTLRSLGFSCEDRLKRPFATDRALPLSLASSCKGMRLGTLLSKEQGAKLKAFRAMNRTVENMRTKVGIKNNVIRKLPKNCPY